MLILDNNSLSDELKKSDKRNEVQIPVLDKKLGLKQLERLAKKGYKNFADGRSLSASSLKGILNPRKGGLGYLDYITNKKNDTKLKRWVDSNAGMQTGSLCEDLLTMPDEEFNKRYNIVSKVKAGSWIGDNKKAFEKAVFDYEKTKRLPVKEEVYANAQGMYESFNDLSVQTSNGEKISDLYKMIRSGRHQKKIVAFDEATNLDFIGYEDIQFQDGNQLIGCDLKIINSHSEIIKRVFSKWDGFNYWLQPTIYDKAESYDKFIFVFSENKEPFTQMVIELDRDALDSLQTQFLKIVLIPFMFYLENGFEVNYPHNTDLQIPKFTKKYFC